MSENEPAQGAEAKAEDGAPAKGEGGSGDKPGRLQQLILEYGVIGIVVLLSLSAMTYASFAVAFMVGFRTEGMGETAGALGAAAFGWALTKPIRIPLAVVLTPVVAAIWHRVRGKKPPAKQKQ